MSQTLPANVSTAVTQAATWPVRLYEIGGDPVLRYTDSDVTVYYDGVEWQPRGVSYRSGKVKLGLEVDTFTIEVDNLDSGLISWAVAQDPTGYQSRILKGLTAGTLDGSGRLTLIDDFALCLFQGRNTKPEFSDVLKLAVKSNLDFGGQIGPKSTMDVTCRFRGQNGFKGPNCGYVGAETTCDYTEMTCRAYGNFARFGGYPQLNSKKLS